MRISVHMHFKYRMGLISFVGHSPSVCKCVRKALQVKLLSATLQLTGPIKPQTDYCEAPGAAAVPAGDGGDGTYNAGR